MTKHPSFSTMDESGERSWLFGVPLENYAGLPPAQVPESSMIYNRFWARYFADVYAVDNKRMTAYIKLSQCDMNQLSFANFVRIDDAIWHVNKVIDYNPASDGTTKVEFVQVHDLTAYGPIIVYVDRGEDYGQWIYDDPVRRRTVTPWEQDVYSDGSVGERRTGTPYTQQETAAVSYSYGAWSYNDPTRSRSKTTVYTYSDVTRNGATVTESQTAATSVEWDGSTYWNGACGTNYYYVDYKKVRTRYTYSDVVRYSDYYNGDSRSRRIDGQCGWVRSTVVVSDWTNTGQLCNAAGVVGAYDCDGTYSVQYRQQSRILEDRYPDGSGGINRRTEYRVGTVASRSEVDGQCGFTATTYLLVNDNTATGGIRELLVETDQGGRVTSDSDRVDIPYSGTITYIRVLVDNNGDEDNEFTLEYAGESSSLTIEPGTSRYIDISLNYDYYSQQYADLYASPDLRSISIGELIDAPTVNK